VLEKLYTELAIGLLPGLARTRITPNQITLANYLNGTLILGLIAFRHYVPAAVLIQFYLFLDILDGNLARYTHRTSRLGQVLDHLGDRLFYNSVMIVIGITTGSGWPWILFFLVAHNLHALLATRYIVPRIRQTPRFRRYAHKQWLMDRGYILGMDLSSQDLIMSALLVTPWRIAIVPLAGGLYLVDLIFRILEVARNRRKAGPLKVSAGKGVEST